MDIFCNAEDLFVLFPDSFSLYWSAEGGVMRHRRLGKRDGDRVPLKSWHVADENDILKNDKLILGCVVMNGQEFGAAIGHEKGVASLASVYGLTTRQAAFAVEVFMLYSRSYGGKLSKCMEGMKDASILTHDLARCRSSAADRAAEQMVAISKSLGQGLRDASAKVNAAIETILLKSRISLLEKDKARIEGELKKAREENVALESKLWSAKRAHEIDAASLQGVIGDLRRQLDRFKLSPCDGGLIPVYVTEEELDLLNKHDADEREEDPNIDLLAKLKTTARPDPTEVFGKPEDTPGDLDDDSCPEDTPRPVSFHLTPTCRMELPSARVTSTPPKGRVVFVGNPGVDPTDHFRAELMRAKARLTMLTAEQMGAKEWYRAYDDSGRVTLPMENRAVALAYLLTNRPLGVFERVDINRITSNVPPSALVSTVQMTTNYGTVRAYFRKIRTAPGNFNRAEKWLSPELLVWRYLSETEIADLKMKKD